MISTLEIIGYFGIHYKRAFKNKQKKCRILMNGSGNEINCNLSGYLIHNIHLCIWVSL
jgi:hypothetical protein